MEKRTSDHEIDLLEVLARLYRAFKNNKLLFILCPVLGIAAGLALSRSSKETVKASMMIETKLINESESKFLIEQLEGTDTILQLTKGGRIKYEVKRGESGDENVYFLVSTVILDKGNLSSLQNAVKDYLNHSEPIARRRHEKEELCQGMIKKIDSELSALDEVKRQVDNKSKATFLEPATLFEKSADLYNKRMKFQIELEDAQSVHIVKGFGALTKSAKWPESVYGIIGLVIGLLFLSAILFIKFFMGYYKRFENTSPN